MALTDLLWACPRCGERRGWEGSGRKARCSGCGTRFEAGRGGVIVADGPGGREAASAAEWDARLPDVVAPDSDDAAAPGAARARVELRRAERLETVRYAGAYVGRFERFGKPIGGELVLTRDRLLFEADEPANSREWGLGDLHAVQGSSGTLQLRAAREPVLSFRFADDSCRFWEALVSEALQRLYEREGRGEIVEFQPRISTRSAARA